MEDSAKVAAKLAELQLENGEAWLVVPNTSHLVDAARRPVDDVKTFVCAATGDVREYQYEIFLV